MRHKLSFAAPIMVALLLPADMASAREDVEGGAPAAQSGKLVAGRAERTGGVTIGRSEDGGRRGGAERTRQGSGRYGYGKSYESGRRYSGLCWMRTPKGLVWSFH
jgi:hypothetical protein